MLFGIFFVAGGFVAVSLAVLLGLVIERGKQIDKLQTQATDAAISESNATASEKSLRMMIEQYNGRPFHIHLSDEQMYVLASRVINAVKEHLPAVVN